MIDLPTTLPPGSEVLPHVRNAVAVASAKGGVGKSTLCLNLAVTLANQGAAVGLLDADIYGPSLQLLTGTRQEPLMTADQRIQPVEAMGLRMMSMGFLTGEDSPVVWRGPLLAQAVQQFVRQVDWGELDILFIDLPPGTGDIPLTLSQVVALSGAVIVTTPQAVALQDVERGIAMFERVEVEVLGLVENMSYYLCAGCGHRHDIFGSGGGRSTAQRLGLPFLGEVPLDSGIRAAGDRGEPIAAPDSGSPHARALADIAAGLVGSLRATWED